VAIAIPKSGNSLDAVPIASPHSRLYPELKRLLSEPGPATYDLYSLSRYTAVPLWFADELFGNGIGGALVRRSVKTWQPKILHSLEFSNSGHVASVALRRNK